MNNNGANNNGRTGKRHEVIELEDLRTAPAEPVGLLEQAVRDGRLAVSHAARPAVYTLIREGKFRANLDPENQCGTEGQVEFGYRLEVKAGASLDGRGFIIDNQVIAAAANSFHTDTMWRKASCERLANGIVANLVMAAADKGVEIEAVRLTVIPNASASMMLEWTSAMELPTEVPEPTGAKRNITATMPFGKFKGLTVDALPDWYLKWAEETLQIRVSSLREALNAEYRRRFAPAKKAQAVQPAAPAVRPARRGCGL